MSNKIALITAIYGGKDQFLPCPKVSGIDYFSFSDGENEMPGWNHSVLPCFAFGGKYKDRLSAKILKILGFLIVPGYDYYIWCDGNHSISDNTLELISLMESEGKEIAVFQHSLRSCLYEEAKVCQQCSLDDPEKISSQIAFYKSEGYPENNGLYELPCFLFKNTERMQKMMSFWWEQIMKYSSRDQISFPYCLFANQPSLMTIPGQINSENKQLLLTPGYYNKFFNVASQHNA